MRRSSHDSLFSSCSEHERGTDDQRGSLNRLVARSGAPIPGLFVFPSLLPSSAADDALRGISLADQFVGGTRDQVMLFSSPNSISLPSHLIQLLDELQSMLKKELPPEIYDLVFRQPLARQVILNLYHPGQGITPHVDLPNRYADGILGVSLIGGTSMVFSHSRGERHEVYLPPRSVYVMTGEARWEWSHGIEERMVDVVEGKDGEETVMRDLRVSVTYRWLRRGGEVLS